MSNVQGAQPVADPCSRFFEIHELVCIFLDNAPTLVLLKAQRVCRLWKSLIYENSTLQQRLFLKPEPVSESPEEGSKTPARRSNRRKRKVVEIPLDPPPPVTWNPILVDCFARILAPVDPTSNASEWVGYEDLASLPWARDGLTMHAPARLAYARPSASWRNMFVSQPPVCRLDWWHEWHTTDNEHKGWGHQDYPYAVTLGMLYDLVEGRLKRGCQARVVYFPVGRNPKDDPTAMERETEWARNSSSQHRGFMSDMPRVKIMTRQVWDHEPKGSDAYNMGENRWEKMKEREILEHDGDGFNVLREGCSHERRTNINRTDFYSRWSRSEAFQFSEIHGESSGRG